MPIWRLHAAAAHRGAGLTLVAAAALWLTAGAGASARESGPCPIDEADLAGFEPTVRAQVIEAQERARREPTAERIGELARTLHAYDRFAAAIACYARARALAPRDLAWVYGQGVAAAQAGDLDAAARALEATLALAPRDVPARVRLMDVWYDLGRLDDSAGLARALLAEGVAEARASLGLGRVLAQRRDPGALAYVERASALEPGLAAAHYARALAYRAQGDLARAREALARFEATRAQPAPVDDPRMAGVVALRRGPHEDLSRARQLQAEGRWSEARGLLERAVAAQPDLVQAHVNLIAVHGALGDVGRAMTAYRTAVQLAPDLAEAHHNGGVLMLTQGDEAGAAAAFARVLAINPAHADAANNLGFLLTRQGRFDEAERLLRGALAAAPSHREVHFNLARLLQATGRGAQAVEHFARAAEGDDPQTAWRLYYLADACARLGRFDEAERHAVAARERAARDGAADLVSRVDADLRRLRERKTAR